MYYVVLVTNNSKGMYDSVVELETAKKTKQLSNKSSKKKSKKEKDKAGSETTTVTEDATRHVSFFGLLGHLDCLCS